MQGPGSGPPRWGGRRGSRRGHLILGQGRDRPGIKAASAGAKASFGVVVGRVLFSESHNRAKAAATSLSIKRLSVQCSSRDLRGPPPAPPPCPTSLATGRSFDQKTSRICSKCWVRRFSSAGEKRGDAGVLGGGCEKERGRGWKQGVGGWLPASPGKGTAHLGPRVLGPDTQILPSPAGRPPMPVPAVTQPVNQAETRG